MKSTSTATVTRTATATATATATPSASVISTGDAGELSVSGAMMLVLGALGVVAVVL